LAQWVDGELIGDGDTLIAAARPLTEARAGDITFAGDDQHLRQVHHCTASAIIVPQTAPPSGKPIIRVADPLTAFSTIMQRLHGRSRKSKTGIHPLASIHPTAHIGADVFVDAFAMVGENCSIGPSSQLHAGVAIGSDCRLGEDVVLHPHVVLYDGSQIGNRVIIHANSVIGADGFGYRQVNGRQEKVLQLGFVEIGDDVEIGACTTIDRGTFGATRIGVGTKIDNLVQIAHNCQIGRHNLLVSQCGIAGSSTTGDHVIIAGQAGIVDHVHIGAGAIIGAQAGVTKNVAEKQAMLGSPATPMREQKRILMTLEKLPEMRRDLQRMKKAAGMPEDIE
jgi:UDP-3-O-[3-hydroxymyristoyl] glucosamine N-acyltransferase